MKLNTRFNVWMLAVFSLGFVLTGYVSYTILTANAKKEALERARLLMETATAVRGYTIHEVAPLLTTFMAEEFWPQTIESYAATKTMNTVSGVFAGYRYKEATLDPTNPRDKAFEWELPVVESFRKAPERRELVEVRATNQGDSLYLARPIKVTDEGCLACHGESAQAPPAVLAKYGQNGFGWKVGEVIGAQIVSVPLAQALGEAHQAFAMFMFLLLLTFVTFVIVLNVMLQRAVIRPVAAMSGMANEVSKGKLETADFDLTGDDEMVELATSFNRMRRSLQKAMRLLDDSS